MDTARQAVAQAPRRGAAFASLVRRSIVRRSIVRRSLVTRLRNVFRSLRTTRAAGARTAAVLSLVLVLGACVGGDYATGPGWEDDRLVGTWHRVDQVHDAWYGDARLETTWQFRSNGRVYYTELLSDYSGYRLEEVRASGRWYGDSRDRVTIEYYDPASWGRETLRYEMYQNSLYLDGLRYDRW